MHPEHNTSSAAETNTERGGCHKVRHCALTHPGSRIHLLLRGLLSSIADVGFNGVIEQHSVLMSVMTHNVNGVYKGNTKIDSVECSWHGTEKE